MSEKDQKFSRISRAVTNICPLDCIRELILLIIVPWFQTNTTGETGSFSGVYYVWRHTAIGSRTSGGFPEGGGRKLTYFHSKINMVLFSYLLEEPFSPPLKKECSRFREAILGRTKFVTRNPQTLVRKPNQSIKCLQTGPQRETKKGNLYTVCIKYSATVNEWSRFVSYSENTRVWQ